MAKRFAYVSFGILCLMVAYQVGARDASADWDMGHSGEIIGGEDDLFWTRSGECWLLNGSSGSWGRQPERDLPIPAERIKLLTGEGQSRTRIITHEDEAWILESGGWFPAEPFPGSPVSLGEQSWGKTKSAFR